MDTKASSLGAVGGKGGRVRSPSLAQPDKETAPLARLGGTSKPPENRMGKWAGGLAVLLTSLWMQSLQSFDNYASTRRLDSIPRVTGMSDGQLSTV